MQTSSPPCRLDIEAELRAVMAAIAAATARKSKIEAALRATNDIEQMGPLHEEWMQVAEEQAQASERRAELLALLNANSQDN